MEHTQKIPKVYAFIDSQNLNLGIRSQGWELDFKKFRLYLKNKYHVEKAYLFIGLVPGNEQLYTRLLEMGYVLVFKPTVEYREDGKKKHTRGMLTLSWCSTHPPNVFMNTTRRLSFLAMEILPA